MDLLSGHGKSVKLQVLDKQWLHNNTPWLRIQCRGQSRKLHFHELQTRVKQHSSLSTSIFACTVSMCHSTMQSGAYIFLNCFSYWHFSFCCLQNPWQSEVINSTDEEKGHEWSWIVLQSATSSSMIRCKKKEKNRMRRNLNMYTLSINSDFSQFELL